MAVKSLKRQAFCGAFLAACLVGTPATAWPVDVYLDVPVGGHRIERLAPVTWVHVEAPDTASAEVLPTGELLVDGKAAGRTLLVGAADGRVGFWLLRVGVAPTADPKATDA